MAQLRSAPGSLDAEQLLFVGHGHTMSSVMTEDYALAESIVRKALKKANFDQVDFGEIHIRKGGDSEEPHFRIFVIYEGDATPLRTPKTVNLFFGLRSQLTEAGLDGLPIPAFVSKQEWEAAHAPRQA